MAPRLRPLGGARRVLAAIGCALTLSGCGTYSWYNPHVPPEIAARDGAECREQARRLVTWELMDDDPFWWGVGRRRHRSPFLGPLTSGLALEQDVYDRCMRSKGYVLIKDPPAPPPAGP